jgi:O-acetyl-ADP-ribose deacetylase (regulator of RNase III)
MRNIRYVVGDLIKAPEPIIAHGCNAQGVMGSGVALAIKQAFPTAYRTYAQKIMTEKDRDPFVPGDIIFAYCNGKAIANCITQEFYGRANKQYVDYNAIRECMRRLNTYCHDGNFGGPAFEAVAMPKIGAALGGGDWKIISEIIQESMFHAEPVVYVLSKEEIPQN